MVAIGDWPFSVDFQMSTLLAGLFKTLMEEFILTSLVSIVVFHLH